MLTVESQEAAKNLKAKDVKKEFLIFEDEGHDVIKFKNKTISTARIVDFFKKHFNP